MERASAAERRAYRELTPVLSFWGARKALMVSPVLEVLVAIPIVYRVQRHVGPI
jgi:hypothetical protein